MSMSQPLFGTKFCSLSSRRIGHFVGIPLNFSTNIVLFLTFALIFVNI